MVSAISARSAGVSGALSASRARATRIASPQRDANPVAAVTDMVSARLGVEINTAVLTSSIEAEKRVLDILV